MASPVRFSPTSTLKPLRLSSSATSRASLIGSFSGASASGYFALPITSANRSAATDGAIDATDKIEITSNARRVLMPRRSNQQGADSACAAATLLYANRIIKPGKQALSTVCKAADNRDN